MKGLLILGLQYPRNGPPQPRTSAPAVVERDQGQWIISAGVEQGHWPFDAPISAMCEALWEELDHASHRARHQAKEAAVLARRCPEAAAH